MAPPEAPLDTISAADHVIELLVSAEAKQALAWALPLAAANTKQPLPLLLLGSALQGVGFTSQAITALGFCVDLALGSGQLPLGVAAAALMQEWGADAKPSIERLAQAFCKENTGARKPMAPPALMPHGSVAALGEALSDSRLLEEVERVFAKAQDAPEASEVAPQLLFSSLSAQPLARLLGAWRVLWVSQGEHVIRQGEPGEEAFVLARGELEVVREGKQAEVVLARLGAGAVIGEMALLSRAPRAANVRTVRPSIVLKVSREELDSLAASDAELAHTLAAFCRQRMIDNLLRTSSLLRAVSAKERLPLIEQFEIQTHEAGEVLIEQGAPTAGMYLIASGEVSVRHRGPDDVTVLASLGPGEVVGEVALVLRRPAMAEVVTVHPTVSLRLRAERFLSLVKEQPALLGELYQLAVERDERTASIVEEEAIDLQDYVLV
jgi:CRP-like cAMP-binding protein